MAYDTDEDNDVESFLETRKKEFSGWCYFCNKKLYLDFVSIDLIDEGAIACIKCADQETERKDGFEELNFE